MKNNRVVVCLALSDRGPTGYLFMVSTYSVIGISFNNVELKHSYVILESLSVKA